jgi:hypothetical protein
MAAIYKLPDGKNALRFSAFETSDDPDVHIYLVAANNAKDDETVKKAAFIDLGSIKGNIGDQNYELPAGVDLSKYRTVTVWCKRFGVNFATRATGIGKGLKRFGKISPFGRNDNCLSSRTSDCAKTRSEGSSERATKTVHVKFEVGRR